MATTEHEILRIVGEKGRLGKTAIVQRLGISTGYADLVTKSLIRQGYLKVEEGRYYSLAPRGAKLLAGEGFKMIVDKAVLEEVAKSVAKEVAREIKTLPTAKEKVIVRRRPSRPYRPTKRVVREPEEEEGIQIKTSFIPPIGLEEANMESNVEELTITEKDKFDIGSAVDALKKAKK